MAWKGETLHVEAFRDEAFEARGWYDGPRGRREAGGPPGSGPGAFHFVCHFPAGASVCAEGTPGRLRIGRESDGAPAGIRSRTGEPALYLSWWVRYDEGWVGSDRPYHPHELHLLTNADDPFVGPARTHLTVYLEQTGGRPFIGIQDNRNVNPACILRNDDQVEGCGGGHPDTFPFGENRSVAACNGLVGEVDGRDCYPTGTPEGWYSHRSWRAAEPLLAHPAPPGSDGWRRLEAVVVLNSIAEARGVADGRIRLWVDGTLAVSSDRVLLRTGVHPELRFHHLLLAPYLGDGSPVAQTFRLANLLVARARIPEV